ncbi:MAG: hypothetical protein C0483_18840 [Pirellula sp.]|nr:hypothetical protein [Pirellula sp.]
MDDIESPPERRPGLLVTVCGVGTAVVVLFVVNWLNHHDINAMGFYLNAVIPFGALLVGVAAGSGYALASRVLQVRLSSRYVWSMVLTGLITYWAALYVTYQHAIEQAGVAEAAYPFTQYVKDSCEQMAFAPKHDGDKPKPLGGWGYPLKALEMLGFVAGGMLPALFVSGLPYCRKCQQFLKPYRSAYLHAARRWPEVKKLATPQRTAEIQQASAEVAQQAHEELLKLAGASLADVEAYLDRLAPTADPDATARVCVVVEKCPTCTSHVIKPQLIHYSLKKTLLADKSTVTTYLTKLENYEQPAG